MDTPNTRAEFERRLFLLRERIESGKFSFPQGLRHSMLGLTNVRLLPNGRIDLLSVNEFARLQANTMAQMDSILSRNESEESTNDHPSKRTRKNVAKKRVPRKGASMKRAAGNSKRAKGRGEKRGRKK